MVDLMVFENGTKMAATAIWPLGTTLLGVNRTFSYLHVIVKKLLQQFNGFYFGYAGNSVGNSFAGWGKIACEK
jgi:hypothetical protein